MAFLSWDSQVGILKLCQMGLLQLWNPITLRANLGLQCGPKKSCSSRRKFFQWYVARLLKLSKSGQFLTFFGRESNYQFDSSLTFSPSFGHNLCFRCPNEQCEPILNIYALIAFQWYKNATRHWILTPEIALWSFGSPLGLHLPKWELPWECEGSLLHTPSHFLTFPGVCDVTPGLIFDPHPCKPFALVASPRLGLWHYWPKKKTCI